MQPNNIVTSRVQCRIIIFLHKLLIYLISGASEENKSSISLKRELHHNSISYALIGLIPIWGI